MLETLVTFIYIIIGIGSIVGSGYLFQTKMKDIIKSLSVIQSAVETTIQDVSTSDEKKKISGIAEIHNGKTVESPLRNKVCLAYDSTISNTAGIIKSEIYQDSSKVPFKLRDGSDDILVQAGNADLYLDKETAPINLDSVRSIISQESIGGLTVNDISVREGYLEPQNPVFIYGDISIRNDLDGKKAIHNPPDDEMVISDMQIGAVRNHLIKRATVYGATTAFLLIAGLITIGLGSGLF